MPYVDPEEVLAAVESAVAGHAKMAAFFARNQSQIRALVIAKLQAGGVETERPSERKEPRAKREKPVAAVSIEAAAIAPRQTRYTDEVDPASIDPQQAIRDIARLAEQLAMLPPPGPGPLKDDQGFNSGDDTWMRAYVGMARAAEESVEDLPLAYHLEAARRLVKYGNTQLDGTAMRVAVVGALEAEAARSSQPVLREGSKLYDAKKGQAKGGHWLWAPEEGLRNDAGYKYGGPDKVSVTMQGNLKSLMADAGLQQGRDWTFNKINGVWYVEVSLDKLDKLTAMLDQHGKDGLADALRTNRLVWEQKAAQWKQGKAAHEEQLKQKVEQEKEKYTAAVAKPIDDDTLREAKALMRQFQRMAKMENRKSEKFYDKGVAIVAELLTQGLKPGATKHEVNCGGADCGKWKVEGRPEFLYVHTPISQRGWEERIRDKSGTRQDVFYWVFPIARALQVSRVLEDVNLPLALSIRLALLAEEVVKETGTLEMLSAMDRIENIPDPSIRVEVQTIANQIPFPAGVKPYKFQEIAIAYAKLTGYRCLIGDSMGVGKTATAIGCLNLAPQELVPAVVMCPASVLYNWKNELNRFAPWFEVIVIDGSMGAIPDPRPGRTVYVLSWDMLDRMADELLRLNIKTMICDESHKIKNITAKRTKAAIALSKAIKHRLLLSGTAMENKPAELWTQLHIIDPEEFPSLRDFEERYSNLKVINVRGRTIRTDGEGGSNLDELADRLRSVMIRRTKSQVLPELPAKTRRSIWVKLPKESMKAYRQVEEDMLDYLCARYKQRSLDVAARTYIAEVNAGRSQVDAATVALKTAQATPPDEGVAQMAIVKLGRLRHLVGELKAGLALDWIADYFDESNKPLVVFAEHQNVVKILGEGLDKMKKRWAVISGAVPTKKRAEIVKAFQEGQLDVFIGTQAAEAGITLTAADTTLFVERWWVPAKEEQAEDRTNRIGQKSATTSNYLMAPDTVDEHIANLVDKKRALVEQVMGGERVLSEAERAEIIGGDKEEDSVSISLAKQLAAKVMAQMREAKGSACQVGPGDLKQYLKEKGLL